MSRQVIAAWAESASGPGWGNQPLWVLERETDDGTYHVECIQPYDQTEEMRTLYVISQAAHLAMTAAVRSGRRAR